MAPAPEEKSVYSAREMGMLYNEKPNMWLLLEVLEYNESGRAEKLRLVKYSKDKDELYEYLMEEEEDWDWNKNYIFVYADSEKQCELF